VSASAVSLGALQGIEAAFSLGRHQPTTERMKMQAERGKRNRHSMAGLRRELLKSATIPHLSAAVVEVAAGGAVGRRRPPAGLAAGQPRLPLLRARQPGRPVRCEAAWQVPLTAGRRAPVTKQSCKSHTAASPGTYTNSLLAMCRPVANAGGLSRTETRTSTDAAARSSHLPSHRLRVARAAKAERE